MFLFIIYLFIIILGFIFKKSKTLSFVMILFMIILFGWSYGNADYNIYVNRFNLFNSSWILSRTEPLFSLLMNIFNKYGFTYNQFLIFLAFFGILVYFYFIKSNTKYQNCVLSLYLIFPFCMDICQIRFYIAGLFVYLGLNILINKSDSKYSTLGVVILFLIASLFHFATIFSFLFLIVKNKSIKKTCILTFLFILFFSTILIYNSSFSLNGNNILFNKINLILLNKVESSDFFRVLIWMLLFFSFYLFMNCLFKKYIKNNKHFFTDNDFNSIIVKMDLTLKFNIIVLSVIPILLLSVELYRIQFMLSFLNYISLINCLVPSNYVSIGIFNRKNFIINFLLIIYSFVLLFTLVLSNNNKNTVFWPVFKNNTLIGR